MNTLYAKLAALAAGAFILVGWPLVAVTQTALDGARLLEISAYVLAGSVGFALLFAIGAFHLLTRRIDQMSDAIETMAGSEFTTPLRLVGADPNGDEIDRLATRIERVSERIKRDFDQLQHTDVSRRELLANVSHDLRSPLVSMQGYLELLLLKHETMPLPEQRSYLEIATRHCERLSKLVRDLFQLTKLESNEVKPSFEPFSATELIQDVLQNYELIADTLGLQLEGRFTEQQVQVHGDIAMIEGVLENLISNALRHTPRGGRVSVEVEPRAERVALRVTDTGCGIAEEDLAKLFDRYYHVDRSEVTGALGTGLGLAIVRHIVELHGSAIRVESTIGQGSVFSFDLPAAGAQMQRNVAAVVPVSTAAAPTRGLSVT